MATKKTPAPAPVAARRLSGVEREKHIAQEAVRYFAEVGFVGDTRELAQRLGVTQSLLYKYFPSKEALINRVYEEVYLGRWNPFGRPWCATAAFPSTNASHGTTSSTPRPH